MKFQLYPPQAIYEQGRRKHQEDSIFPRLGEATDESRLFMVCDGIGGYDKGETASSAVCEGLSLAIEELLAANGEVLSDALFQQAMGKAYDELEKAALRTKIGTTMTCLCLHSGGCLAAHLGDSRIYHLRPLTGEMLYRSTDHSLVQHLYETGEISYQEMRTSPRRNIILKAMVTQLQSHSQATLMHITDIQPGDYFYLCSDGMLERMDDSELMGVLQTDACDEEKAHELTRLTAQNNDNHSAYLIHIKKVER